jgi:copper resistance protein D
VIPHFDLGEGGVPVALLQGMLIAAAFSAFGSLLFLVLVVPSPLARVGLSTEVTATQRCLSVTRLSLYLAIVLGLVWFLAKSAIVASATNFSQVVHAVPIVTLKTMFGHVTVAQLLALAAAAVVLGRADRGPRLQIATGLSGLAVVLHAWHLHAAAMYEGPSALLACEVLHVLAASAWLGSLVPLMLLVRATPPDGAAILSRRYSRLGATCVLVLAVTAFWQGWVLVGSMDALQRTAYGWMVLLKATLFAILVVLAWRNRFQLTPALAGAHASATKRALERNIVREAVTGLIIVLVASVLASLPPGMHMEM